MNRAKQVINTVSTNRCNESNNRWNINWERIFKAKLEHNANCIHVDQSSLYRWTGSHPLWGGLIGDWLHPINLLEQRSTNQAITESETMGLTILRIRSDADIAVALSWSICSVYKQVVIIQLTAPGAFKRNARICTRI
jgi:hypothetical protein